MNIHDNFLMLLGQFVSIVYSPFSRLLILVCSAQIASMIAKFIISSFKAKKFSLKSMVNYGGMPSSHTVFITTFVFGIALDQDFGWNHPFFTLSLVLSALVLIDTIRLRGTIDKINDILKKVVSENEKLKKEIKMPKKIAHTPKEVMGGLIFSFGSVRPSACHQ